MTIKNIHYVIFFACLIGIFSSLTNLPSASSQASEVPDWIKNNAKWWADGLITEGEYLTALQYLADQGILKISSTQKPPLETKSSPQDDIRAQSVLVRFSGGEFVVPVEISTFSNFLNGEKPFYLKSFYDHGFTTYFSLESNPSVDKLEFYKTVASFYDKVNQAKLFNVDIDVLSGNNISIATLHYSDCSISEYLPYLQNSILFYQYSGLKGGEIRDRTVFHCSGVHIIIDKSDKKQELEITDPPFEDRVVSYVVHFMGTEFDGLYSVGTFSNFSPSKSLDDSPYEIKTYSSNPVGSEPQFYLESLPSIDKKQLYKFYSKYVNSGRAPELFDVSIDLILGDQTILQRWNYHKCTVFDYRFGLEDSRTTFPFAKKYEPEIRDKSDFACQGFRLDVGLDLPQTPIKDAITNQENFIGSQIPDENQRAKSFIISRYGGELSETFGGETIKSFENIRRDRGALTPNQAAKQYDRGFIVESLPTQDKKILYEFLSRYTNPGKIPEPFDIDLDTILGDDSILQRFHYTNCDFVDFTWYLQQGTWLYQFNGKQQEEIRERYAVYCEGLRVEFP